MRKIIFGGNFDPIHNGHLQMAKAASKQLDADIVFVPAKVSVWKDESDATVKDKFDLIYLSTVLEPRFSIDLFEATRKENTTYTYDTVIHFMSEFSDDEWGLLIGGDQVKDFHKWKKAKTISNLLQIYYYERPGYPIDSPNIKTFNMKKVVGDLCDVSSTDVRNLRSLKIHPAALEHIIGSNLYFMKQIKALMDRKRVAHCISVANLCYEIANKHKIEDKDQYFIAGLIHDIGKSCEDKKLIMETEFPEYLDMPEFSYHQFVGVYLAKKTFGIVNEDVLKSIEFHATGCGKMTTMMKVVYAADKIDPNRGYDSSKMIRAMKKDIDEGFKMVLKENMKYLKDAGKMTDNRLTSECCKKYLK